jgi:hypothetical protein
MYLTFSACSALTRISLPRKSTADGEDAEALAAPAEFAALAVFAISNLEISMFNLCDFL